MTTHQEWLIHWAERWVRNANAEIQHRQEEIAELQKAISSASTAEEKESYESLIEEYEAEIDSIRQSHRFWQRRAKRRWELTIPDLK